MGTSSPGLEALEMVESLPSEKHLQVLTCYPMLSHSCGVFEAAEAIIGLDPVF